MVQINVSALKLDSLWLCEGLLLVFPLDQLSKLLTLFALLLVIVLGIEISNSYL